MIKVGSDGAVHEEFRKDAIVPKITGRADAVLNEKHLPGKKWSKRRASASSLSDLRNRSEK